jgi:hypothetical protein
MLLTLLLAAATLQTPRLESPVSELITYRVERPLLKWDQAARDETELQTLRFALIVDAAEPVDLEGVTCGPATGQTPQGLYSCVVPAPALPNGDHTLALIAWVPAPSVPQPRAARIVR